MVHSTERYCSFRHKPNRRVGGILCCRLEDTERLLLKASQRKREYEGLQTELRKANLQVHSHLNMTRCSALHPSKLIQESGLLYIPRHEHDINEHLCFLHKVTSTFAKHCYQIFQ